MYLRQSTASQEIILGPFLDSGDGVTAETGLTIANTDIKLFKGGATSEANKNSGGATHIASGRYYAVLDATDTDTLGNLVVNVVVSGALAVQSRFTVLPAAVYDAMIAGSGNLSVTVATPTFGDGSVGATEGTVKHVSTAGVITRYATLAAAHTAVSSGTLHVYKDETITSSLSKSLTYVFAPGVTITGNGVPVFDDGGSAKVFRVRGGHFLAPTMSGVVLTAASTIDADIESIHCAGLGKSAFDLRAAGITATIRAKRVTAANYNGIVIEGEGSTLTADCEEIIGGSVDAESGCGGVEVTTGASAVVRAKRIASGHAAISVSSGFKSLVVDAEVIETLDNSTDLGAGTGIAVQIGSYSEQAAEAVIRAKSIVGPVIYSRTTTDPLRAVIDGAMIRALTSSLPSVTAAGSGLTLQNCKLRSGNAGITAVSAVTVGIVGSFSTDAANHANVTLSYAPPSDALTSSRLPTASYTAPPTAIQNRQEMDANSTKLTDIKAKTDNLGFVEVGGQTRVLSDANSTADTPDPQEDLETHSGDTATIINATAATAQLFPVGMVCVVIDGDGEETAIVYLTGSSLDAGTLTLTFDRAITFASATQPRAIRSTGRMVAIAGTGGTVEVDAATLEKINKILALSQTGNRN